MITFQKEMLSNFVDEVEPLIKQHYDEIALHKDIIKLAPDWPRYFAMEELGNFVAYTVRDDGKLVGYSAFFLHTHIHYKECRVAANDVIYIDPAYRRGTVGVRLINFCREQLKKTGATKITWHIKYGYDWSSILKRMGAEDEEKVMAEIL